MKGGGQHGGGQAGGLWMKEADAQKTINHLVPHPLWYQMLGKYLQAHDQQCQAPEDSGAYRRVPSQLTLGGVRPGSPDTGMPTCFLPPLNGEVLILPQTQACSRAHLRELRL